ncbi:hypothetical protein H6F50_18275 [Coleofasciculus sp. FACHB-712]|nr:hypothetical protein [Coleofasciculus sp. FACHB-712]
MSLKPVILPKPDFKKMAAKKARAMRGMYFSILTCDRFAFNLQQHLGAKQSNGISDRIHSLTTAS